MLVYLEFNDIWYLIKEKKKKKLSREQKMARP